MIDGISSKRMRKPAINGASQARLLAHHSGNDAAIVTKAIAALQINGEIFHAEIVPKNSASGNIIASAKNTAPMIARPPYMNRFLKSILPPSSYTEVSSISSDIICSHEFFREPNIELSCAAESDPQEAERTSLPRTGEGSCRRLQRRSAR